MARKLHTYVKAPTINTMQELNDELLRIQEAFDIMSRHIATERSYNAPDKPVDLQVAYTDATKWNPGQGAGYYIFLNGAWKKFTIV